MPKTRQEKQDVVEKLTEAFRKMRSAVFANYEGLTVPQIEKLRRLLQEEGVHYTVAKKTLLKLALKQAGSGINPKNILGNFATVVSFGDEVAPARILAKFAKENEALKVAAGILEGKLIDKAAVLALAKLPSKQELLGKLAQTLNAPISGLVNVLAGNLRNFVYVLNAIKSRN